MAHSRELDFDDYQAVLDMQGASNPSGVEYSLHDWAERIRATEGPGAVRNHPLLILATSKLLHVLCGFDCSAMPEMMKAYDECKRRAEVKI